MPMPPWPIRASARGWTSRQSAISTRWPRAACSPISPSCSTSIRRWGWRASAAEGTTPSSAWISASTSECARAIWRSRARRRTASWCSRRIRRKTPSLPTLRGWRTSSSRVGSSVMTPEDPFRGIEGQAEAVSLLRRVAAGERIERGAHPDVTLVQPTPPEGNPKGPLALRIEDIRALERRASLKPAEAAWKVFIVDGADKMTAATPQAFLKTLEEPPARTVIVLILLQLRALPATVLSRCQIVRFQPRRAPGTLALLSDGRGEARRDALGALAEAESEGGEAILKIGEALGRDRQAAEAVIETCWLWYRDLLCALGGGGAHLAVFGRGVAAAARRHSLDDVVAGLRACREAWQAVQGNVSPRLTVEVLLSRLAVRAA